MKRMSLAPVEDGPSTERSVERLEDAEWYWGQMDKYEISELFLELLLINCF